MRQLDSEGKEASVHLYGQDVNPETYTISKADLILKREGVEADNMQYGHPLSHYKPHLGKMLTPAQRGYHLRDHYQERTGRMGKKGRFTQANPSRQQARLSTGPPTRDSLGTSCSQAWIRLL